MAATNSFIGRTSPVEGSTTSIVSPAKSTNTFSPAAWLWRMVGRSRLLPGAVLLAEPDCSQTRPDARRDTPPTAAPGSRPCGAAPCRHSRPIRSRASARRLRGSRRPGNRRRSSAPSSRSVGQGPAQPRHAGALQIGVHRPIAEPHRPRDHALAQPALELQTQNIADPAHRQSLGWHGPLAVGRGPIGRWDCRRTRLPGSSTGCSRSRGMAAHDRVESVLMIAWTERSRSSGIGAHDAVEYAQMAAGFSLRLRHVGLSSILKRQCACRWASRRADAF